MKIVLFGYRLVLEKFPRYTAEIYRSKTEEWEEVSFYSEHAAADWLVQRVEQLKRTDYGYSISGVVVDTVNGNRKGDYYAYEGEETTSVTVRSGSYNNRNV